MGVASCISLPPPPGFLGFAQKKEEVCSIRINRYLCDVSMRLSGQNPVGRSSISSRAIKHSAAALCFYFTSSFLKSLSNERLPADCRLTLNCFPRIRTRFSTSIALRSHKSKPFFSFANGYGRSRYGPRWPVDRCVRTCAWWPVPSRVPRLDPQQQKRLQTLSRVHSLDPRQQ